MSAVAVERGVAVTLTASEMMQAALVGIARQVSALRDHLPDKHGFDGEDGWTVHIEGACGEMALAKCLGRYWSGSVNTFRSGGDVGLIQVRTRSRSDYELLIRPNDSDEAVFVLVLGKAPTYRVMGWLRGRDAKQAQWSKSYGGRPPAYFVPHHALHSPGEL